MGPLILNRLREFGDLPRSGIVAGQAIDSAITDLFGPGGGVYNDVDIFRHAPRERLRSTKAEHLTYRSRAIMKHPGGAHDDDYDPREILMELIQTYSIKSVSRQGMLNLIYCRMADGFMADRLTADDVISGFDINSTRVAIDLADGQLVWDQAYAEFLKSRELRICMMHTPWHTFLRLLKKHRELPDTYLNREAAAQACVGVAQSESVGKLLRKHDISLRFGGKFHQLAESLSSEWSPYFSLETQSVATLSKNIMPATAANSPAPDYQYQLAKLVPRSSVEAALQARLNKFGRAVITFAARTVEEFRAVKPSSATAKLRAIQAQRVQSCDRPSWDFVYLCSELLGTAYVQGQALPDVAAKVGAWLAKHPGFRWKLFGMTLAQQWETIARVTATTKQASTELADLTPEHALGILETGAHPLVLRSTTRTLEFVRKTVDAERTPFTIEPLPLPTAVPKEFSGFEVTELLTPLALAAEGQAMRHCVGGYSSSVRSNKSRILSIRHPGKPHTWRSTVELQGNFAGVGRRRGIPNLRVVQNYARENKLPAAENEAYLKFLVQALGDTDR